MDKTRDDMWTDLDAAFATLRALPFPRSGRDPRLQDAHATLAEYDGYIAGIITRLLRDGGTPAYPLKFKPMLREHLIGLTQYHESVGSHAILLLTYLDQIEEVVQQARTAVAEVAVQKEP
jgi:hypothetical protein